MRATLFGATGKTGPFLIQEAQKRGFDVTVFARPSTPFARADVRIVRGDLTDERALAQAIRGSDAVLSALGPTRPNHPKGLPVTRATKAILSVMRQEGVGRIVAISTGTAADPGDRFDWKVWLPAILIKRMLPSSYADMIGLAQAIRESELDWTMVRAALLKDRKPAKRLNVGLYGLTNHSFTISRQDIATFIFEQIARREFVRQAPGVSSR